MDRGIDRWLGWLNWDGFSWVRRGNAAYDLGMLIGDEFEHDGR